MATAGITRKYFDARIEEVESLIDRRIKPLEERVNKIDHVLFGNGEIGWDEKLRLIETYIKQQQEAEQERKANMKKLMWSVVSFMIPAAFIFLYQFFVFWTKIVPMLSVP